MKEMGMSFFQKNAIQFLAIFFLLVLGSEKSHALIESPNHYRGLRPLGMGNAFIAVSDDQNALTYNPAGLNDVEKYRVEIINPTIEVSTNVIDIVKEVIDITNDVEGGLSDEDQSQLIEDVVNNNLGRLTSVHLAVAPAFTMKNFAIRFLVEGKGIFQFRNAVYPHVFYNGKVDTGIMTGGAYGLWDKSLQVGAAVRPLYRLSTGDVELGAHNIDTIEDTITDFQNGLGVGFDVGLKSHLDSLVTKADLTPQLLRVFNYLRPAVGITWQDILNTKYEDAEADVQTVSVGSAVHFDAGEIKNTLALDVRDINRSEPITNKINVGLEVALVKYFAIRGGLKELRPSAGLSVDLWLVRIDAALYPEEIANNTRLGGDYRAALQIMLGF